MEKHEIRWVIIGKELDKFRECKFKDQREGPETILGTLPCALRVYPRGLQSENYVDIYLICEPLKHNILKLDIKHSFIIKEINYKSTRIDTYDDKNTIWGNKLKSIKTQQIITLNKITIVCEFQIMRLINRQNKIIPTKLWTKYINKYDYPTNITSKSLNNINILSNENNTNNNINNNNNNINDNKYNKMSKEIEILKNEIKKLKNECKIMKQEIRILKNGNKNDEIKVLLDNIGLDIYYDIFIDEGIETIDDIKSMSKSDLKDIGINKILHRNKIMNAVLKFNGELEGN